ncbi:MAG: hypothetical protein ABSF83_08565 [Nitrososphaerales archaeon]
MPDERDLADGTGAAQSGSLELTQEEAEALAFLRGSKRVDLRWMNEEQRQRIETVLDGLHNGKRVSLLRISKEAGRSYTAIWGLCRALGVPTRGVAEADKLSAESRSKHKRRPFDGTQEDRAYLTGFADGDYTALQVSGTAVMASSSTTHPASARLFHELSESYGHVYQHPMFERDKGYRWRLAVRPDNSFRFLLPEPEVSVQRFSPDRQTFSSYLAGFLDSDGNIKVGPSTGYTRIAVAPLTSTRRCLV